MQKTDISELKAEGYSRASWESALEVCVQYPDFKAER